MIHSQLDTDIWDEEFDLLTDQEHLEKVWSIMLPRVEKYVDDYLEGVSHYLDKTSPAEAYSAFLNELIKKNDKLHDKYHEIFDMDLMEEEYSLDVEGFKSVTLKKECDVIRTALQSKTEALNEWKTKFYGSKSQQLYDTFYNMMVFASEYDEDMNEEIMEKLNIIDECAIGQMGEDACYKSGVLGYGIVSNILNHMYPRVFPGNYKTGVYALLFLTGVDMKGIDMPSGSSEFCMIKDDFRSKTGIIEAEHNYYYPYETFTIYTTRIYRVIVEKIRGKFKMEYPTEFRYLITNDFYEYVTSVHREAITTMAGNDDVLKFNTIW